MSAMDVMEAEPERRDRQGGDQQARGLVPGPVNELAIENDFTDISVPLHGQRQHKYQPEERPRHADKFALDPSAETAQSSVT